MLRDCTTLHMLEESKMGKPKKLTGRVIMAGLHQRPDAINAKNLVGHYPGDGTVADLVRRNVCFYSLDHNRSPVVIITIIMIFDSTILRHYILPVFIVCFYYKYIYFLRLWFYIIILILNSTDDEIY